MSCTTHLTAIPTRVLLSRGITDAEGTHKLVMSVFDGAELGDDPRAVRAAGNILWRDDGFHLLVRSTVAPTHLPDGAQTTVHTETFAVGDTVRFTVTVDAIARTSVRQSDGSRRISERWISDTEVPGWLAARLDGLSEVTVREVAPNLTRRKGTPMRHLRITGTARVADVDRLSELIIIGVGRSKAFGCGLLTVKVLDA